MATRTQPSGGTPSDPPLAFHTDSDQTLRMRRKRTRSRLWRILQSLLFGICASMCIFAVNDVLLQKGVEPFFPHWMLWAGMVSFGIFAAFIIYRFGTKQG